MKFMGYGAGVRGRRMIAKWGGMGHDVIVGVFDREKKGSSWDCRFRDMKMVRDQRDI